MEKQAFKIFGKVLMTNKTKVAFNVINKVAIPRGYFVPQNLCYGWLLEVLKEIPVDYSSTFYEKWYDIMRRSRLELLLDQVKHYASTYGTNFQGEIWLPEKDAPTVVDFPFEQLKVLEGITNEELIEKVKALAYSNVAVKEDTINFLEKFKYYLEIDKVGIRQLKIRLIDENYKFRDGQECLNWILFKFFDIPMLIKNKKTLGEIAGVSDSKKLEKVLRNNSVVLSQVFLRNKDIFLRIKQIEKSFHNPINHLRKLARKNHKPMPKSKWLILEELSDAERLSLFRNAPIFKLVQIYNALSNPTGYYIIRNGKAWYKSEISRNVKPIILEELLLVIIEKTPKDKKVLLPKGIELAMPSSEKNFIGDIPLGSTVDCASTNTIVGIYWRNEWGAYDLDLHCYTISGNTLGWNSDFRDGEDIVFSGDMTNADPEATELMWFRNRPEDSIVNVNEYSGDAKYKFRFLIAREKITDFRKGYMVDPRSIIYSTEMEFENKSMPTLGFFRDGKFVFHSCNIGNSRIPSEWRESILQLLVKTKYLTLREVLEMANVEIVSEADEDIVSLNTRGELIEFFS